MNKFGIALLAASSIAFSAGCATKNHVRQEMTPVVNKVNELDDLTNRNSHDIRDVDSRSQQGIQMASAKAAEADQKAASAAQRAGEAQTLASQAATGVDQLSNTVVNLDNYKPVVEASVHFAFGKADLTRKGKQALDQLAAEIPNTKGYIVQLEGGTDSVGGAQANYALSQRRAAVVTQYLAEKHNVPAHKIFVIGLGKDKYVASNGSAKGRAENRRVDVRLMSNVAGQEQPGTSASNQQPESR
jgi:OmpA-OmpF porin, OOP family